VTTTTYNAAEEAKSVKAPSGGVASYGYDADGNLTSREDPDSHAWTYAYDADGELTKATDPLGNSDSYGYDGDGNQTSLTDGRGIITTTAYNLDGKPTGGTYSDGTPSVSYAYDADGEVTSVTDSTGTRGLTYDGDGELTAEGAFSYGYDSAGNITSRQYPDGTAISYAYDDDGQVTLMAVGSAETTYSYDAAGNLTSTAEPDGVTETRTYDDAGQLTGITDATSSGTLDSYGLTLNADGQPAAVAVTRNGIPEPGQYYGYDSGGRLTSECYSSTGASACSAGSQGTATGTAASSGSGAPADVTVTAGPDSATVSWTPPTLSGGKSVTGYVVTSSGGQKADVGPYATSAAVTALTADTSYTFTVTADTTGGASTSPVTSAITPGNEATYGYDAAGNLTTSQTDGVTTTSAYNSDEQLTSATAGSRTTSYGYDADGNQTSAGNLTLAYNAASELTGADTPAGHFTYSYDGAGDLATASLNGTEINDTAWDLNNPLPEAAEDTTPSGTVTTEYAWNPGGTLNSQTVGGADGAGTTYGAVTDWQGSLTGLVNPGGGQVTTTAYTAYGTSSTAGTVASNIGFAASYTLPGSALDDMRARDYNPATDQFTSVDPMLATSGQPYGYADDSPAAATDPTGDATCPAWLPGCGVITDIQNNVSSAAKSVWDGIWTDNPCTNPHAASKEASAAAAWPAYEGWGNCYECAVQIERILGGGRVIKISPPPGARFLGPSTNNPDGSPWAYHYAVESDGRMYDSFTGPEGLPISEYTNQFDYWEILDIDPAL
jgi:RHS repeat-associated protein